MKRYIGIAAVLSCAIALSGGVVAETAGEPNAQSKRTKKDFGEMSMLLGDVEWKGTSAQAKRKNTTLIISGARMDGPLRSKVRQQLNLYLPEFHGPGAYTAKRGSMFLVVGMKLDAEADTEMDPALVEALTKAKHLQLEGAEVVVESDDGTEVVGSFSSERGPTRVTNGRFRAIHKK